MTLSTYSGGTAALALSAAASKLSTQPCAPLYWILSGFCLRFCRLHIYLRERLAAWMHSQMSTPDKLVAMVPGTLSQKLGGLNNGC